MPRRARRIDIQYRAFNLLIIDHVVTITESKYHDGNKPKTRRIYVERKFHENMINRLVARGWKQSVQGLKVALTCTPEEEDFDDDVCKAR